MTTSIADFGLSEEATSVLFIITLLLIAITWYFTETGREHRQQCDETRVSLEWLLQREAARESVYEKIRENTRQQIEEIKKREAQR